MKRRAILVASGAWLAVAAARSLAQVPQAPRRIAFLHPSSEAGTRGRFDAFYTGLKDLGYVEGRDIVIESHWADGKIERLPSLAAEVVARKPAVIVTATSAAVAALKKATSSIPIVFATAGNPVEQGFVASLRRPGGNVTGITLHFDLNAKLVEIVREALPAAQRLGVLIHEPDPAYKIVLDLIELAAKRFKFELVVVRVTRIGDFDRAFEELAERKANALLVPVLAFLENNSGPIVELALRARLPLFNAFPQIAVGGGLLSYGTEREENFRRAAALVDKILRGAKPGELAVEQPERFELVVNLKTAKAIGVTLPTAILLRATKVIE